jgi:hypothetical protein
MKTVAILSNNKGYWTGRNTEFVKDPYAAFMFENEKKSIHGDVRESSDAFFPPLLVNWCTKIDLDNGQIVIKCPPPSWS